MKYLKNNKNILKLIIICLLLFLLIAIDLPYLSAGPSSSDDYQYWKLATHLSKEGTYGFIDPLKNKNDDFAYPLNDSGIRRGEVGYTLIIFAVLEVTTSNEEISSIQADCIENLNSGGCSILGGSTVAFNLIILLVKLLTALMLVFLFPDNLNKTYLIICLILYILFAPYYHRDFIVFEFLLIFLLTFTNLKFLGKNYPVRYLTMAFVPLFNSVFLYVMLIFLFFEVLIIFKNKKIKFINILLILFLVGPSTIWSLRNMYQEDSFVITARGNETVGIRAEFVFLNNNEYKEGFVFFTPDNFLFTPVKNLIYQSLNVVSPPPDVFDRSNSQSKYRKGHSKNGEVFSQMQKNLNIFNNDFNSIVNQIGYERSVDEYKNAAYQIINQNKINYIKTISLFSYRGLFPEYNFKVNSFFKKNNLENAFNIFDLLRIFPVLYIFKSLYMNRKLLILNPIAYMFLFLFLSYALFTHFIPRYSVIFIPFTIFYFIFNNEDYEFKNTVY